MILRTILVMGVAAMWLGAAGCSTFSQRSEVARACQPPNGDPYSIACKQAKQDFKHAQEREKREHGRKRNEKAERKSRERQIKAYFKANPEVKPRLDAYRSDCFVKSGETLNRPACEAAWNALHEVSPVYAEYYRACDPYEAHQTSRLHADTDCRKADQKRNEMYARY